MGFLLGLGVPLLYPESDCRREYDTRREYFTSTSILPAPALIRVLDHSLADMFILLTFPQRC